MLPNRLVFIFMSMSLKRGWSTLLANTSVVKMCDTICQTVPACSCHLFSPVSHACILFTFQCYRGGFKLEHHKDILLHGESQACECAFSDNKERPMDVEKIQDHEVKPTVRKELNVPDVLVMFVSEKTIEFHFFNPLGLYTDTQTRILPCPKLEVYTALYVKALELVFLASEGPDGPELKRMYLLSRIFCKYFRAKLQCLTMAFHHPRRRIYIIRISKHKIRVYSMPPNGSSLQEMFRITGYTPRSSMAIDENKDRIYIGVEGFIISFTTQGKDVRTMAKLQDVSSVGLNPAGTALYFGQSGNIFRLDLMANISKKLDGCQQYYFIQRFNNIMFVTGSDGVDFTIIEDNVCSVQNPQRSASRIFVLVPN